MQTRENAAMSGWKTWVGAGVSGLAVLAFGLAERYPQVGWLEPLGYALLAFGGPLFGVGVAHKIEKAGRTVRLLAVLALAGTVLLGTGACAGRSTEQQGFDALGAARAAYAAAYDAAQSLWRAGMIPQEDTATVREGFALACDAITAAHELYAGAMERPEPEATAWLDLSAAVAALEQAGPALDRVLDLVAPRLAPERAAALRVLVRAGLDNSLTVLRALRDSQISDPAAAPELEG